MRADEAVGGAPVIDTLENVERRHILRALGETKWVIHGKKALRNCWASTRAFALAQHDIEVGEL